MKTSVRHLMVALLAGALGGGAAALGTNDTDGTKGGDPTVRKPLLPTRPVAPAAIPVALPDTSALMPAGNYTLRLTLKGETLVESVKLVRNGGVVNAAVGASESLSGTLAANGQLMLSGGSGADRIDLAGSVQNRRGNGSAKLGRGANQIIGSFTLDPDTAGARKLQEYGAPKKPKGGDCGFFCRLGKAWDCLKSWTTC